MATTATAAAAAPKAPPLTHMIERIIERYLRILYIVHLREREKGKETEKKRRNTLAFLVRRAALIE